MRTPTVLIAEDSLVVRAVLVSQLRGQGYAVIEAQDGREALERCRTSSPDVVLLDVVMPVMDGHEVLTALRADPRTRDIPVVFLTGRVDPEHVVEGLRLGAHDYLRKPFEPTELVARVSAAMRVKQLQDELRHRNAELELISRTDALTGLHNRRHVEEQLFKATGQAAHHNRPVAVLLLDIDHFKTVNDDHGHPIGDIVLRHIANQLLGAIAGEAAVLGRWGGEEFLVVLPDCAEPAAVAIAERLRRAVQAAPARTLRGALTVTISVGCASAAGSPDPEKLLHRADAALYAAKDAGRNRVLVAAP